MPIWWLSFADPKQPQGSQFLGVCIVDAASFLEAIQTCHKNRLLTRAEAEEADTAISAGEA